MSQLDLLSILDEGTCTVGGCDLPVSHTAVCVHPEGTARVEACLRHANYFACAWLAAAVPPYSWPGVRDVVWMEVVTAAGAAPQYTGREPSSAGVGGDGTAARPAAAPHDRRHL